MTFEFNYIFCTNVIKAGYRNLHLKSGRNLYHNTYIWAKVYFLYRLMESKMILDILHFKDCPCRAVTKVIWIKVCIGAFYLSSCFGDIFQLMSWNRLHDLIFVLLFLKQTKLLIISVKFFIPRIFLKTKDVKWSCFHIFILRFIGEEWLSCWKEGIFCSYYGMKTTAVYLHCMNIMKRRILYSKFCQRKISLLILSILIILGTDYSTSHLVILVQKR